MGTEHLAVLLNGKPIGTLVRVRGAVRFRFDDALTSSNNGSPMLSTALVVRPEAYDARATFAWFSGLLPEEDRLKEIQRFFGIAEGDYLETLRAIGWECAGAVEILPSDVAKRMARDLRPECSEEVHLSPEELAARLAALPSHPYDNARTMRTSLGGFQEKLCVSLPNDAPLREGFISFENAFLPIDGAPTTHILKPQPARFPGMIEAEAWGMAVASRVVPTARTALLELPNAPLTLVVERFDRAIRNGRIERIHQEDCAQALGLDPGMKYAAASSPKKSDPTYRKIADVLTAFSIDPIEEKKRLLRSIFVTVILGNTDAHAKNFALLHPDEGTVTLAPLYDVIPACEITPGIVTMGMRIDGRIRIDRVGIEQMRAEARTWGLPNRMIDVVLNDAAERLRQGVEEASEMYPRAGELHAGKTLERLDAFWKGV